MPSRPLAISEHSWACRQNGRCSRLEGFNAFCIFTKRTPYLPCREGEIKAHLLHPRLYGLVLNKDTAIPSPPDTLVLVPRRDVPRITSGMSFEDMALARRYVLVTFVAPSSPSCRKRISRLSWRTPLIRLGRGLVLVPQVRLGRFRPYRGRLLRPSDYVRGLADLGAIVRYAPRLQIHDLRSEQVVQGMAQHTVTQKAKCIIKASNLLAGDAGRGCGNVRSPHLLRRRLAFLRSRMMILRYHVQFLIREFGMDFRRVAARAAAAVSRARLRLAMCVTNW